LVAFSSSRYRTNVATNIVGIFAELSKTSSKIADFQSSLEKLDNSETKNSESRQTKGI
jgi:hypothetical protein